MEDLQTINDGRIFIEMIRSVNNSCRIIQKILPFYLTRNKLHAGFLGLTKTQGYTMSAPNLARLFLGVELGVHGTTEAANLIRMADHNSVRQLTGKDRIPPNMVVLIDNRPGPKRDVFDGDIRESYYAVQDAFVASEIPSTLPEEYVRDPELRARVELGLANSHFKDTSRFQHWLDVANRYAKFADFGLHPLELTMCRAQTDIETLENAFDGGDRPAGVVLSGSPKMLSKAAFDDSVVQKTLELSANILYTNIPVLGVCFGMQMLAYIAHNAMVDWLKNPAGMNVRIERRSRDGKSDEVAFLTVKPGENEMAFGNWHIRSTGARDPIMRYARNVRGMEVHSQGLFYPHPLVPNEDVLAISSRHFREHEKAPRSSEVVERIIEVMRFGAVAYGTQLHPEFSPDLLLALSYIPKYEELLEKEGLHVGFMRELLKDYPRGDRMAGQRFGYNWVKYVLLKNYVERQLTFRKDLTLIQRDQLTMVLADINEKSLIM